MKMCVILLPDERVALTVLLRPALKGIPLDGRRTETVIINGRAGLSILRGPATHVELFDHDGNLRNVGAPLRHAGEIEGEAP